MGRWQQELDQLFIPDGRKIETLTPEWWQARRGRITASSRANTIATVKQKPWQNLAAKLLAELEPHWVPNPASAPATDWGNDREKSAFANIELALGVDAHEPGCIFHKTMPFCSATPDLFLDDTTIAQVKCPFDPNIHLATFYKRKPIKRLYQHQVQFEAWVAGRHIDQILFVSFDPLQPRAQQLAIIEVPVDRGLQDRFDENAAKFQEFFEKILEPTNGAPVEHRVQPIGIPILF